MGVDIANRKWRPALRTIEEDKSTRALRTHKRIRSGAGTLTAADLHGAIEAPKVDEKTTAVASKTTTETVSKSETTTTTETKSTSRFVVFPYHPAAPIKRIDSGRANSTITIRHITKTAAMAA